MKVGKLSQVNVWPVAQRELREGARRPVNRRLRWLSAGGGTLLLWIITSHLHGAAAEVGGWLFAGLHTLLLGLIFLIVPALAADDIAREKREGTLGLLFLTPLSAGGIVAGKALAQGLRAFTLWLAVLPILAIPFMTGGITWFDALSALSLEFCAAVLCLAAGLLASSLARKRNTAFVLAFLFGGILLMGGGQIFGLILLGGWRGWAALPGAGKWSFSLELISLFLGLFSRMTGFTGGWSNMRFPRLRQIWVVLCLCGPPAVLLFFIIVMLFAALRIERSWQDKPPSLRRESLLRRFCAPLARSRFQRKLRRTLDWNPIAWLQEYSWRSRLSKWGLCLAIVVTECAAILAGWDRARIQGPLLLVLAGMYTFAGVNGFLEEKHSGALELLLVTPVSVNRLIFGRAWGLWKQFLPACLALAFFSLPSADRDAPVFVRMAFMLGVAFLALPVFATYAALRVKNLIAAAALTWIALWVPFSFAMEFVEMFRDVDETGLVTAVMLLLSYGGFVMLTCFLLRHSLSRRIYSF